MTPKRRQGAFTSLPRAAGAALLLPLFLLGCGALSLPREDAPAAGPSSAFNTLISEHISSTFKDYASYEAFEISDVRWVHSTKGWVWLTCVRFTDKGRRYAYALFVKDNAVTEARYAVETDACGAQIYSPFMLRGAKAAPRPGVLEPLY